MIPKTDEDKLKLFHEKLNQYNTELLNRGHGDFDQFLLGGQTQIKFNNSIDHTYGDVKLMEKSNSFAVNENSSKINLSRVDVLNVPEYAEEIFNNEKVKDNQVLPDCSYMTFQTDINEKMRRILIDWLLKVHSKFKLLPETFYLTVNIIDRYLSKETISRKVLQLIGVTAMHISGKYEEIYPPEANDFVYITDNAYTKAELLDTEYKILKKLEFNLTFASSYRYLEWFAKKTKGEHLFSSAHRIMNYSLIEYSMIKYEPRMLAAGALYLAYAVDKKSSQRKHSQNSSHTITTNHSLLTKGRDSSGGLSSSKIFTILGQETGKSENDIKRGAIDINICKKAHGSDN